MACANKHHYQQNLFLVNSLLTVYQNVCSSPLTCFPNVYSVFRAIKSHPLCVRIQAPHCFCSFFQCLWVFSTKEGRHTFGHRPFLCLTMSAGPLSVFLALSLILSPVLLFCSGAELTLSHQDSTCLQQSVSLNHTRTHLFPGGYIPAFGTLH